MSDWNRFVDVYNHLLEVADETDEDDAVGIAEAQEIRDELHVIAAEADAQTGIVSQNPPQDVNIAEIGWGVEIETAAPITTRVGNYHGGTPIPYLPPGWMAQHDGSIMTDRITHRQIDMPGYHDCEVVSPGREFGFLHGADGIHQIVVTCAALEEHRHKLTNNCGVHVTLGWADTHPMEALDRLITIVAYLEKGLYASTGSKSREEGRYCKPIRRYGEVESAKRNTKCDRYHGLNLTNSGRVEFRFFSGSMNPVKICSWVQVCMGLIQRAIGSARSPSWTPAPPKGGWSKKGEGSSEVERLLSYIAWHAGQAKVFGGVHFGLLSEEIPLSEMMSELRRLAKKYDSQEVAHE